MIEKLIIATGNKGKYKEFCEIVKGFADELIFAPEIASLIVEETGRTYQDNAMLKARAWAEKSGLPCLADDSGLEVEALDGAPGLYSARIVPGKDENKVSWILEKIRGVPHRNAKFVSALALYFPNEYVLITQGYCYGKIADEPRGCNGFGYDPIFYIPELGKTSAQISADEKNMISHRGKALRAIAELL